MTPPYKHWADLLTLREEITNAAGQIADLQMSLYSAVYTDRDVPYADCGYYAEITEPTERLKQFMGAVARRLGTRRRGTKALFHLDQGMGGGKSHALVGLYHLANDPETFLTTELGQQVKTEAERLAGPIDLSGARAVVLSADNMTPGATSPEFGPATNLHERFLWSLLRGDKALYNHHVAEGPNKAALARALEAAGSPVLILLDELMDYAMLLSDKRHLASMPGEKAFLNSLMDAVDEVDQVAFVVVMIRSDYDERGYTVEADDLRAYVAQRLERNGLSDSVTEAGDFSAIIRRRLFEPAGNLPAQALATHWTASAHGAWQDQVFARLGNRRTLATLQDRLAVSYPLAPDLMALVHDDWSPHAGFQRVRSTVEIFAATAYYWMREHAEGRWAPDLIGIGDLPLHVVIEHILSSGLLHGNERAVQGYRQVAATDVITKDGRHGRARELDEVLTSRGVEAEHTHPALRMASALFCYSLVPRAQAKRGATKPELLAAIYVPGVSFQAAEEVFNA
jgi:predicted AAA+ superfamily ATPase